LGKKTRVNVKGPIREKNQCENLSFFLPVLFAEPKILSHCPAGSAMSSWPENLSCNYKQHLRCALQLGALQE